MKNRVARNQREKDAGFSLLEVLVAATLMGMMLVVILEVLTSALQAQGASRSNTEAVLVAEKVIAEYSEMDVVKGVYQGREGRFDYQVRLDPQLQVQYPMQNKRLVCSSLQVVVSWKEQGKTKTLELQTLRTVVQ
ncbi:MAG: type IV pilus modification PilV family protein [Desulfobaccales bacterium]